MSRAALSLSFSTAVLKNKGFSKKTEGRFGLKGLYGNTHHVLELNVVAVLKQENERRTEGL